MPQSNFVVAPEHNVTLAAVVITRNLEKIAIKIPGGWHALTPLAIPNQPSVDGTSPNIQLKLAYWHANIISNKDNAEELRWRDSMTLGPIRSCQKNTQTFPSEEGFKPGRTKSRSLKI